MPMMWTGASLLSLLGATNASGRHSLAFSSSASHSQRSGCIRIRGHHHLSVPSSPSSSSISRGAFDLSRPCPNDCLRRPFGLTPLLATDKNDDDDGDDNDDGIISAGAEEGDEAFENNNAAEKINDDDAPKPPRLLAFGYATAALFNLAAGLVLISNIGTVAAAASSVPTARTMTEAAAATANTMRRGRTDDLLASYAAGALGYLFLAAGSCGILSESAKSNELHDSETHKRLTMGTLIFGTVGIFSLPGEAACLSSTPTALGGALIATQSAKFVTAFVSFLGWEHGAGGFGGASASRRERWINIGAEIARGCGSVRRNLPVADERPANFYRTFFIFVTLGNLAFNVPELVFNLRQGTGLFSSSASLALSSVARLGLLSAMLYVLKDATERKRLEGTTFIKLNMMVGLWAFGVGIAQGLSDVGPFNVGRAADKFLFGLLFLNNGVLSQLTKMGIIKKRDEVDPDADPPLRIGLF